MLLQIIKISYVPLCPYHTKRLYMALLSYPPLVLQFPAYVCFLHFYRKKCPHRRVVWCPFELNVEEGTGRALFIFIRGICDWFYILQGLCISNHLFRIEYLKAMVLYWRRSKLSTLLFQCHGDKVSIIQRTLTLEYS